MRDNILAIRDWLIAPIRWSAPHVAIAVIYFALGRFSLTLAFQHANISPVWPPTGFALGVLVLFGRRYAIAVAIGAFAVMLSTGRSVPASAFVGLGNALEAFTGCWLLQRITREEGLFSRARNTAWFLACGVLLCTTVSATIGVTALSAAGTAPWSQYFGFWRTWWLGDAMGALVVAPFLICWLEWSSIRVHPAGVGVNL